MGDERPQRRQPFEAVDQPNVRREEPPVQKDTSPDQPQNMDVDHHPSQLHRIGHVEGGSTLDMGHMANVLPHYRPANYGIHPYEQGFPVPSTTTPSTLYPYPPNPQFTGQARSPYVSTFAQQYPDAFLQNQQNRVSPPNYAPPSGYPVAHGPGQPPFTPQPYYQHPHHHQQQQPAQSYSAPYTQSHPAYAGLNTTFHPYSQNYGTRHNPDQLPGQMRPGTNYFVGLSGQTGGEAPFAGPLPASGSYPQPSGPDLSRHASESSLRASAPRGPPRKPRQSGHALWVGNLPPGTHVTDLKDHFSKTATKQIESVFLISKSNCAFVNYKTESACADAMTRFHDSRFQGVRLVCRLRRGSSATSSGAPAHPPPGMGSAEGPENKALSTTEMVEPVPEPEPLEAAILDGDTPPVVAKVKEKFFVVKSLTKEDLELSVRNRMWATQAHNEAALNKAYQAAENVYLIFSANKSGEYFGYARMASSIDDEALSHTEPPPLAGPAVPNLTDVPVTIPTPATAFAPKGRIIDDSARGTIFWEADVDTEDDEQKPDDARLDRATESDDAEAGSPATPQSFGKPFQIEWLSTERLPFYRTRGLRNPWNANREVKIARDGTELEPSVGRRLISMFHSPQSAPPSAQTRGQLPPGPVYPTTMAYLQHPPSGRPY